MNCRYYNSIGMLGRARISFTETRCFADICDTAGVVESLLQLESFVHTAVCTRPTQVYELSVQQWSRMLQLGQNQHYREMMLRRLQLRLTSRASRPVAQHVPLYGLLLKRAAELIQQSDNLARQVKLEFHDADTDTDILARIIADTSDTRDFCIGLHGSVGSSRHLD